MDLFARSSRQGCGPALMGRPTTNTHACLPLLREPLAAGGTQVGRPPLQASCEALVKGLPGIPGVGPPRPGRVAKHSRDPRGAGDRLHPPQRDLSVEGRCCPRLLSESEARQLFPLLLQSRGELPESTFSKRHTGQALGSNSIRGIAAGLPRPRAGSAILRNQVSLLERPAPCPPRWPPGRLLSAPARGHAL